MPAKWRVAPSSAGQIDEMSRKADWYPSGGESGLRNQFASYGRSSGGKYLTDAEEAAYKRVIRREGPLGISHEAGSNLSTIGALSAGRQCALHRLHRPPGGAWRCSWQSPSPIRDGSLHHAGCSRCKANRPCRERRAITCNRDPPRLNTARLWAAAFLCMDQRPDRREMPSSFRMRKGTSTRTRLDFLEFHGRCLRHP